MKIVLFVFVLYQALFAQKFSDYFEEKTLRFDYYHIGNDSTESIVFDEMIEEPIWGGRKANLIDTLNLGDYKFTIKDSESNSVIYSQNYSTLFGEWRTTDEAKKITRSYSGSVVFPYPKDPVTLEIYSRNRENNFIKLFSFDIDPDNYFIGEKTEYFFGVDTIKYSGEPTEKYDIVFIPEGYTESSMDKFIADCDSLRDYLFRF